MLAYVYTRCTSPPSRRVSSKLGFKLHKQKERFQLRRAGETAVDSRTGAVLNDQDPRLQKARPTNPHVTSLALPTVLHLAVHLEPGRDPPFVHMHMPQAAEMGLLACVLPLCRPTWRPSLLLTYRLALDWALPLSLWVQTNYVPFLLHIRPTFWSELWQSYAMLDTVATTCLNALLDDAGVDRGALTAEHCDPAPLPEGTLSTSVLNCYHYFNLEGTEDADLPDNCAE